ncbi:AraC family transcriptional regulator [Sandaracinus amylolyticus]|uniref:AraC family transcriptional regulator n=1 Tax=Sandaracinus amylolyticus TaxID=927083 RepID=UPI001F47C517|nr:AraC family transcriptional regulator [Sandaracinus amylolyticus]UJR79159.1 AraC family transcriptional regulator [Sandaracinus amylolyticus]
MAVATVVASFTATLVDVAVMLGVPREEVLARAELTPELLANPDARVPFKQHMAIWDVILALPDIDDLGVRLGRHFAIESLGALGYLMLQCATPRELGRCMERFGSLLCDVFIGRFFEEDGRAVLEQVLAPRFVRLRHPAEWSMSSGLTMLRTLTGRDFPVLDVWFQHPAPPDVSALVAHFGRTPRFGAPASRLVLPGEILDVPIVNANPRLYGYLEHHAHSLLKVLPGDDRLTDRVQRKLTEALRHGVPSQSGIARHFGMSERTLQRRLKEEGVVFQELLEDTRRQLAEIYLREPRLAVYEVAMLVGYSEPSAFFRAFRRWTGRTPEQYRAALA